MSNKNKRKNDPLAALRSQLGSAPEEAASNSETVFRHETQAANLVGGKRHAGSGALTGLRSDASSDDFQVECKQTGKQSMTITTEWLNKISREAAGQSKEPLLHLRFLAAAAEVPKDWVVISEYAFRKLLRGEE